MKKRAVELARRARVSGLNRDREFLALAKAKAAALLKPFGALLCITRGA
ncbi:MAG: hypothetical protein QXG98_02605 [Candidatus Micrarchaeia archaeon]